MSSLMQQARPALVLLVLLTLITGLLYPLAVTGIAQSFFARQANGSLLVAGGAVIGSQLVGQPFSDPGDFWGRPSATADYPYNAAASSGSNLGPTSAILQEQVADRAARLQTGGPAQMLPVPVDLVTASGSGLDPHISPAAAYYQVARVAQARGLDGAAVRALVDAQVEGYQFGFLGQPRVNVLQLNLALDALAVE